MLQFQRRWAQLIALRFVAVGLSNTAVGYAVILLGLGLGAGDYLANAAGYAAGLILAYVLHRRWTFAVTSPATFREMSRFALAAAVAYAANLSVIHLARSMGYIDNPLIHALAMSAYSVSFFVLNRFIVFARPGAGGMEERPWRWADRYPECALVFVAVLTWLFMRRLQPMGDVDWQFWIARQLLGGARFYADIWEVNPPLWFWSAMPLEWLAERSGIAWLSLLVTLVVGLGVVSAWLVGQLLDLPRQRDRLAVLLLVFVMVIVLPMAGLAQREQLALMTSLPYAALIARRHAGRSVPVALAAAVAVLGAYGFALKHYFTLIPLVLELWLGLRLRRGWRPWRPELVVLAVLAATYAACVLAFAPEFLTVMVPMVRTAYDALQPPLLFVLVKPYVLCWVVAGGFLLLTRDEPLNETTPSTAALFEAVLLVSACFALGYFVQRRGWDYHSIPATGTMAIALGLRLMRFRRALPTLLGALILSWLVFGIYPLRNHSPSFEPYLDRLPAGNSVFVASIDAGAAGAAERHGLIWASRGYSLWMMPAIAKAELVGPNTPELRHLAALVLAAASQDIRCAAPQLILLENMPPIAGKAGAFTFRDFLFRDARLRQFVADHYIAQAKTPQGTAYLRRGPVGSAPGLGCRKIR